MKKWSTRKEHSRHRRRCSHLRSCLSGLVKWYRQNGLGFEWIRSSKAVSFSDALNSTAQFCLFFSNPKTGSFMYEGSYQQWARTFWRVLWHWKRSGGVSKVRYSETTAHTIGRERRSCSSTQTNPLRYISPPSTQHKCKTLVDVELTGQN